jgi:hypothetical protein
MTIDPHSDAEFTAQIVGLSMLVVVPIRRTLGAAAGEGDAESAVADTIPKAPTLAAIVRAIAADIIRTGLRLTKLRANWLDIPSPLTSETMTESAQRSTPVILPSPCAVWKHFSTNTE